MAHQSSLATIGPPRTRPTREAVCPLSGALGGALSGFATTGTPVGACIGRGALIGLPTITQATSKGVQP